MQGLLLLAAAGLLLAEQLRRAAAVGTGVGLGGRAFAVALLAPPLALVLGALRLLLLPTPPSGRSAGLVWLGTRLRGGGQRPA